MRRFSFFDGRIVEADSPVVLFESLRLGEHVPAVNLDRYLDLIRSRGALGYGIQFDVGERGQDMTQRCARALASLISAGWVRPLPRSLRAS
jgi:hypothetical protein